MEIFINGQSKTLPGPLSAENLIKSCCKNPELAICELNGSILNRQQWETIQIKPHDRIELVSFVGGG